MTAPAPKRRSKAYDPRAHWRKVDVYVPAALSARLERAAASTGQSKKDLVIAALDKRLPRAPKPADESGNG